MISLFAMSGPLLCFMQNIFLAGSNPVLTRELRVVLRNVRTFMLLAIYVAVLGAIVLANFPSEQALSFSGVANSENNTAARGRELLQWFLGAQALLVWVLVPSLATGALSQERERQTLEPLLLSPLTQLQIIWGKAAGVLSITVLLLLSTLPLTSLCFLLGGVAPGELLAAYGLLLGQALFLTSLGLYCAAKWQNSVQAIIWCYILIGVAAVAVAVMVGPGMIVSGVAVIRWMLYQIFLQAKRLSGSPAMQKLGIFGWIIGGVVLFFMGVKLLAATVTDPSTRAVVLTFVFIAPYLFFVARFILQSAAHEMVQRLEPRRPRREWLNDMKSEWERSVIPPPMVYVPSPSGEYFAPPVASELRTSASTNTKSGKKKDSRDTYGVQPFLSEKLNPVLAKDLRHGLGGEMDTFLRYGYAVTIGTEVLLLTYLLFYGAMASASQEQSLFGGWAKMQMVLLLLACAWLGSRAVAPEREQQVLPQLLTAPIPSGSIVSGKMMSVMVFAFYVFMLGLPLTLFLPMLGIVPWSLALSFVAMQLAFGALCASWGIFCSMHCVTVRRALGWSLGGVLFLLLGGTLLTGFINALQSNGLIPFNPSTGMLRHFVQLSSPLSMLDETLKTISFNGTAGLRAGAGAMQYTSVWMVLWPLSILMLLAMTLLISTARSFKQYIQTL
jgi:ABC-type transport system involved in multi-copper enzyme maturation permease subunit